jgi:hypothetical protein
MAFSPNDAALQLTPAEADHLKTLTTDQIGPYLRDLEVERGLIIPDWDPTLYVEPVPGSQPKGFAKTLVINGVKTILEAASETELLQKENALLKQTFENAATTQQEQQDESPRILETDDGLHAIENDLVARSLRDQGIDPEALREFSDQKLAQSWASAVEEFKSGVGRDWPGGTENMKIAGEILAENNLPPTADSLARVFEYMRKNDLLAENPALTAREKIANAQSPEELREALGYRGGVDNATLFGR